MIKIKARQVQRSQTAAEWAIETNHLLKGEIGVESDTGRIKAGQGDIPWSELPYTSNPEVFWVVKGTTTWSQLQTALTQDKIICCKYGQEIFYYMHMQSGEEAHFVAFNPDSKRMMSFILYDNSTYSNITYFPLQQETFEVVYNSTQWNDISNAYAANKILFCRYQNRVYYLTNYYNTTGAKKAVFTASYFDGMGSIQFYSMVASQSNTNTMTYTVVSQTPESTFNKVNTISSSSTYSQYPCAKAVYDFVNTKTAIIIGTLNDEDMTLSETIAQMYTKYTTGSNIIIRFDNAYNNNHIWTDLAISHFEYNVNTGKYALGASSVCPASINQANLYGFYQTNLSGSDNHIIDPNVNGFNLGIIEIM